MTERFAIKRGAWKPLLAVLGGTAARSWVDLDDDGITARFGWYRLAIPWGNIESVEAASWPWYGGVGWRSDLRHTIGLIGAYQPVVRIRLSTPQPAHLLRIPIRLTDLYISLDDPTAFIASAREQRAKRTV